jgi:hypothetical protein
LAYTIGAPLAIARSCLSVEWGGAPTMSTVIFSPSSFDLCTSPKPRISLRGRAIISKRTASS